jgi:hypothetical protein
MQQPKQNHKTKEYWDAFYSDLPSRVPKQPQSSAEDAGGSFEWIVANSPVLLDEILMMLPLPSRGDCTGQLNALEIGCGVSELSRCLLQRLIQKRAETNELLSYEFVATDMSEVCIDQCSQRDANCISLLNETNKDSLKYETLDILTAKPSQRYHVILDKGTLDTFLFRSKRTKKGSELYPPLLLPLLNNIHAWLKPEGKYIIISPRGRIKAVRDYIGFNSVKRVSIDVNKLGGAVLMESNADNVKKNEIYIYECIRNDEYKSDVDEPFRSTEKAIDDRDACPKCRLSFKEFRGNVEVEHQGKIGWQRKWNNHAVHCKGLAIN